MNVYTAEFIAANEVKDKVFNDRRERNATARRLRQEGWMVTVTTYPASGVYAFHAERPRP